MKQSVYDKNVYFKCAINFFQINIPFLHADIDVEQVLYINWDILSGDKATNGFILISLT